jgi:hypothetical protein
MVRSAAGISTRGHGHAAELEGAAAGVPALHALRPIANPPHIPLVVTGTHTALRAGQIERTEVAMVERIRVSKEKWAEMFLMTVFALKINRHTDPNRPLAQVCIPLTIWQS